MRYLNSIFVNLLKPVDRRQFREIVERHDGAYDKSFKSWDHLVTLIGAQLGQVASLRAVEGAFNANSHQHYHLGVGKVVRSTLSDANARRPVGVFAETFAMLAEKADRHTRVEGAEMVRLIDSSPVPLGKMCEWAEWNGRIRGMKMHIVYHPGKCPALRRDYTRDRQRRRNRPPNRARSWRYLCFRQRLLSLRLVEEDQCCQGFLRYARQGEHALAQDEVPLPAQDQRRRLQSHRRCQCIARQQGRFQSADPIATHQGQG